MIGNNRHPASLLICAVALTSPTDAQRTFERPALAVDGQGGKDLTHGDLDHDGTLDLVSSSLIDTIVEVRLGIGAGEFALPLRIEFPEAFGANEVSVVDVDRDGTLDIVGVLEGYGLRDDPEDFYVLLGMGGAEFAEPIYTTAGDTPRSFAVADLNGDDIPDVVLGHYDSEYVTILLGNGDGTFEAAQDVTVGLWTTDVALVDVDGDSTLDLGVVQDRTSTVRVLAGLGNGLFDFVSTFPLPEQGSRIAGGNFDGDSFGDFAITYDGTPEPAGVYVLYGSEGHELTPGPPLPLEGDDGNPNGIAVYDMDGDEIDDLLVAARQLWLARGTNSGLDSAEVLASTGGGTRNGAVGDFDNDGHADVALMIGPSISLLFGDGDQLGTERFLLFEDPPISSNLATMDSDRALDLVTAVTSTNRAYVHVGDARGAFIETDVVILEGDGKFAGAADIDGDGTTDLITLSDGISGGRFQLFTGNGDGTVSRPGLTRDVGHSSPIHLQAADLNMDGHLDVAVANQISNVSVLLGEGDGSFGTEVRYETGAFTDDVDVGDFDGDGWPDLLAAVQGEPYVALLFGAGEGAFGPRADLPLQEDGRFHACVGDIDGDELDDIVALSTASSSIDEPTGIELLYGNGDGSFAGDRFEIPGNHGHVQCGDIDGDGSLDLIATASTYATLLINDGGRRWSTEGRYGIGSGGGPVVSGDVDLDGQEDFVVPNSLADSVTIQLNRRRTHETTLVCSPLEVTLPSEATVRWTLTNVTADQREYEVRVFGVAPISLIRRPVDTARLTLVSGEVHSKEVVVPLSDRPPLVGQLRFQLQARDVTPESPPLRRDTSTESCTIDAR